MRGGIAAALLATGAAAALLATRAFGDPAGGVAPKDRAAIEAVIHDYLIQHPEVISDALSGADARASAKAVATNRTAIETPFAGAAAGPADADVRLVVFFDYACAYCKASSADVRRLLADDKRLRVVFRDFPVLGPASDEAALASLSAAKQGRYVAFHDAVFGGAGRLSHDRVIAAATAAGLDPARTAKDAALPEVKAEVARNLDLGRQLQLTGTPSYVVGDRILSGAVGYDALKAAVAAARKAGTQL